MPCAQSVKCGGEKRSWGENGFAKTCKENVEKKNIVLGEGVFVFGADRGRGGQSFSHRSARGYGLEGAAFHD